VRNHWKPVCSACPEDAEDTAERYLLRRLPAAEAERFEEHYIICENCAAVLSEAEDYISSIRAAGLRLSKAVEPHGAKLTKNLLAGPTRSW